MNGRLAKNTHGITGDKSIECTHDVDGCLIPSVVISRTKRPREYAEAMNENPILLY